MQSAVFLEFCCFVLKYLTVIIDLYFVGACLVIHYIMIFRFANKQDKEGALLGEDVANVLDLENQSQKYTFPYKVVSPLCVSVHL